MSSANPIKYNLAIKSFINNKELSDVSFLVDNQVFHAHKFILAMSSEPFKNMLFGDLKETVMPIKIPDITAKGFSNLLNYLYSYEIDIKPSELYESFQAADKYLVTTLLANFFDYVKSISDDLNCCLIYDQLVKINKDEILVNYVRKIILFNSKTAITSPLFLEISLENLIDILKMESLSCNEIYILKSCSSWINCELQRNNLEPNPTNTRKLFAKIKHLINFSSIFPNELKGFTEINNLLTIEEIGHLYMLHLEPAKYSLFPIKCETKRKQLKLRSVKEIIDWSQFFNNNSDYHSRLEMKNFLSSNRRILISSILTNLRKEVDILSIIFKENDSRLIPEVRLKEINNNWLFIFYQTFLVEPNKVYELIIMFKSIKFGRFDYCSRSESTLNFDDNENKVSIKLNFTNIHCIKEINFFILK